MKMFLTMGLCLMFGVSLVAGCGGSGSAIPLGTPLPQVSPTMRSTSTPSTVLSVVNPPPAQPSANVGQYFNVYLWNYTQGGTGNITWKLKSGTLPSGLTFSSDNTSISGIPTAVSVSTVVFSATDSGSPPASVNVSVSITIAAMLPLAISPSSGTLPAGTVGAIYNPHIGSFSCGGRGCRIRYGYTITASGGVVPYSFGWATTSSSLPPPGLTLGSFTGLIGGTPTMAGTYNFTVTATDSESPPNQKSANYTIAVAPAPSPPPSTSPSPSASP